MDFISGEIIAVDKPLGWTSFDVVKRLRGAIQRRLGLSRFKVGHAGTLDPLATLRLGATTPSFDLETEVDATYPYEHVTEDLVRQALPRFRGDIMQVPPVYSAVKVDGRRAYKFARKGREVELRPKPLRIDALEMTALDGDRLCLRVVCSKGTYIRALARDIGPGAHLVELRRTRVGDHDSASCLSLDQALRRIADCTLEFPDDYRLPESTPTPGQQNE